MVRLLVHILASPQLWAVVPDSLRQSDIDLVPANVIRSLEKNRSLHSAPP
jgi:hypothetical protein